MSNDLRRWIALFEAENQSDFYMHISPIKNLRSILSKGLVPNIGGGNYAGYEQSLDGVYVTTQPNIIFSHTVARQTEHAYILVLVQVPETHGIMDEDVLDAVFDKCVQKVMNGAVTVDSYDPNDRIWKAVIPVFLASLGPPNEKILRENPGLVEEYFEARVHEHYGADVDPLWWEGAKEKMIQAFPQVSHPTLGNRYSLRIPGPIGYTGDTKILAVITIRNGESKIVKGTIPSSAQGFVQQFV